MNFKLVNFPWNFFPSLFLCCCCDDWRSRISGCGCLYTQLSACRGLHCFQLLVWSAYKWAGGQAYSVCSAHRKLQWYLHMHRPKFTHLAKVFTHYLVSVLIQTNKHIIHLLYTQIQCQESQVAEPLSPHSCMWWTAQGIQRKTLHLQDKCHLPLSQPTTLQSSCKYFK